MSDLAFRCPHCAHALTAPEAAVGRSITCPDCKRDLTVPAVAVAARGAGFLAALNSEIGQIFRWMLPRKPPQAAPSPSRPERSPKSVRRSVQGAEVPATPTLRVRTAAPSPDFIPPAAVVWRPQARRAERRGLLAPFLWILGILVLLAILLYQVPLGNPKPTTDWQRAADTFGRLQASPGDGVALRNLRTAIESLVASGVDHSKLVGLVSVYGLGAASAGNEDAREKAVLFVERAAPASPYGALLTPTNGVTEACPDCSGTGHGAQPACLRCKGSGQCSFCDGGGTAPGLSRPEAARRLTHQLKCSACRGTGLCQACRGIKATDARCQACNGQGHRFAQAEIGPRLATAITMARNDTVKHIRKEDALDWLRRVQASFRQAWHARLGTD